VEVVKAAKFAPKGIRGFSSFSISGKWGSEGGEDWVIWSDAKLLVGVMIENTQIMDQIDRVFAIEGIDYCLFGPADFSMSLGLRSAKKNHPKVQDAIKRTVEAAAKHGKAVGIGIGEPWKEEAQKYIELGCRIIEIGHELAILKSAYASAASAIRPLKP